MPLPFARRSQKQHWPLLTRLGFRQALRNRQKTNKDDEELQSSRQHGDGFGVDVCLQPRSRRLLAEAHHGAAEYEEDADEPLNSARDLEGGEEEMPEATAADKANNFKELMEYAAQDKKEGVFIPITGNLYQYWGLGITDMMADFTRDLGLLSVVIVQVLAPPACIIYFYYQLDWTQAEISLEDWHYRYHSRHHGVSNMLKHFTAVLFLFMFALNGATETHRQKVIAMKVNAMLNLSEADFVKGVRHFWISLGRWINCIVIVECCVIVYLAFVSSEGPVDVVFNALAVTFLYNLDDIGAEMAFLSEDDWDGEELGKYYYLTVEDEFADNEESVDQDGTQKVLDPDDIQKHSVISAKYRSWVFSVTEKVMYFNVILLPCIYIFVSGVEPKPSGVEQDVAALQKQVADLLKASGNH
eukprot:TRINITY_DN16077_c0_g1_i1.p1 TRINITY_DN16077_c0_g1~~TRINITY_DN16077_c0_g1_i1.p1  ORF type:complete len:444 (+),score=97.55 TRINITY_DN16077_c0_g1_i1:92-1333(+)